MHYSEIKYLDIANGTGVRTTLFVSGCRHRCKGCFNATTWNFDNGFPFTEKTQKAILKSLESPWVEGLTLLGGEPFEPENQRELVEFVKEVKESFPYKNIWAFTGGTWEGDLRNPNSQWYCEVTDELLSYIDVLVDGPFIEEKKNISLKFRGSENQRIIDVQASLKKDEVVLANI